MKMLPVNRESLERNQDNLGELELTLTEVDFAPNSQHPTAFRYLFVGCASETCGLNLVSSVLLHALTLLGATNLCFPHFYCWKRNHTLM